MNYGQPGFSFPLSGYQGPPKGVLSGNISTLQGSAGPLAINVNDLLEVNQFGQLFSVGTSDFAAQGNAGSTPIAATTVTSYAAGIPQSHKMMFTNPADSSIFVATAYLASNYGLEIFKYSSTGAVLGSVIIDATSNIPQAPAISQLSNGNLVITWGAGAGGALNFAITDINLNVVVAKTQLASAIGNSYGDSIALSGGGFAVAWTIASNLSMWIYTNAGVVVSTVPGASSPQTGGYRLAQLSNGNIAISYNTLAVGGACGHAIISVSGAIVLAYTVLDPTQANQYAYPEIQVLPGCYAISVSDNTNTFVYVLSNSGTLQGAAYQVAGGVGYTKLLTDGTNFWLVAMNPSVGGVIALIPTTGTKYVVTSLATLSAAAFDAVYDKGFIVITTPSAVLIYRTLSSGLTASIGSITTTGLTAVSVMKSVGDFSVLVGQSGATTVFSVMKYLNTAIVGVSQQAIPAGNAGQIISYSHGGGSGKNGYISNPILGSVGKGFNHSATNVAGNVGTMLGNSVALEGVI